MSWAFGTPLCMKMLRVIPLLDKEGVGVVGWFDLFRTRPPPDPLLSRGGEPFSWQRSIPAVCYRANKGVVKGSSVDRLCLHFAKQTEPRLPPKSELR
jgi:hypothetical protein